MVVGVGAVDQMETSHPWFHGTAFHTPANSRVGNLFPATMESAVSESLLLAITLYAEMLYFFLHFTPSFI